MKTTTKKAKFGAKEISLTDLCFPVDIIDNPKVTNQEYSKVVTGIVNDVEMDLNYCSPKYTLIKNEDVFPHIEETLQSNHLSYNVTYKHINHVRFYAEYILTDKSLSYKISGTNDEIMPMIRVNHSYNGLTKYGIQFGYFRMICSNGLTVPVAEMVDYCLSIGGKHTESVISSFKQLSLTLQKFVEEKENIVAKITGKYDLLAQKQVASVEDRIEKVLKEVGITAVENSTKNTIQEIAASIQAELNNDRLGFTSANDWLIYNGINQYLFNDNNNIAAPEKRVETDSKVLEYMLAH